jgi:amino acid transporter
VKKVMDFFGANLFLLAVLGIGLAWLAIFGRLALLLGESPEGNPWIWGWAALSAVLAMGVFGKWLHGLIARRIYSPTARPRSGARSGATVPGVHHHS